MPRDIPIGNGSLLITFDQHYCLRDIYYPYAGKENHSGGNKFRFGIWTDNVLSWINKDDWKLNIEYAEESLMTHVTALHDKLELILHCNDLVDYKENIFIKKIQVKNLSSRQRDIRVFFHHDFRILESAAGDTAYYDPDEKAIIHYKKNRYFLISGVRDKNHGISQYATGVKEFRGLQGTWIDATVDASIYAPFYFGVFDPDDEKVVNTMNAIKSQLWVKTSVGGIARYKEDRYHKVTDDYNNVPGNPWIICTLWLAQWYIARAGNLEDLKKTIPILEWVASRAFPSGILAEQVNPFTAQPLSVSPLTWSHATFAATVLEYLNKLEKINICPMCKQPIHTHIRTE